MVNAERLGIKDDNIHECGTGHLAPSPFHCLLHADRRRSRMPRYGHPLAGVGDLGAVHLEDRDVLVEIVADIEVLAVRGERDRLRQGADLDVLDRRDLPAVDLHTRSTVKDSALSRVKYASAAARCSTAICPVRTLIDRADENSVATQSLISSSSGFCSLSQVCIRPVAASWVSAATSSEVSR